MSIGSRMETTTEVVLFEGASGWYYSVPFRVDPEAQAHGPYRSKHEAETKARLRLGKIEIVTE
jgi:hypothetical protein